MKEQEMERRAKELEERVVNLEKKIEGSRIRKSLSQKYNISTKPTKRG